MSLNISYDDQLHLLTCKVSGYLSIEEYKIAMQEILKSKDYPCDVTTLWDLRDMKFDDIDIDFEKKLVDVRKEYSHLRGGAKIALLYNDHLAEPLFKLYSILSKDLSQNTRAFTIKDEAMYWLVYGDEE